MQLQNFYAQDVNGNIVPGAICSLFLPGTTKLATGLEDANGALLSNPFSANSNGLIQLAAPNGAYDLKVEAGLIVSTLAIVFADTLQALAQLGGFLPPSAIPPVTREDGTPLQIGDRYMKTPEDIEYIYKTGGWQANNLDGQAIAASTGSSLIGVPGVPGRTLADRNSEAPNIRDYITTTIDGVTSNQAGIVAAVAANQGGSLLAPVGTYISTDTIPGLHNVRWYGDGVIKRGSDLFKVAPLGSQTNTIYCGSSGSAANDGITADKPINTLQNALNALVNYGPMLPGVWVVKPAAGTLPGGVTWPDNLGSEVRVQILGPVVGASPAVPTAIFDGGGTQSFGLNFSDSAKVLLRDIKFQNFLDYGVVWQDLCDVYALNVHGLNITGGRGIGMLGQQSRCRVYGGKFDNIGTYGLEFISDSTVSVGSLTNDLAGGVRLNNCGTAGVLVQEGSTGHIDYATVDTAPFGFDLVVDSRINSTSCNFKNISQTAVRRRLGSWWLNFNNTCTFTGVPNRERAYAYSGDTNRTAAALSAIRTAFDAIQVTLTGSTAETTLKTYSSPTGGAVLADSFDWNGRSQRVVISGQFTGNSGTKTLRVRVGASLAHGLVSVTGSQGFFKYEGVLQAVTSATQAYNASMLDSSATTTRVDSGTRAINMITGTDQSVTISGQLSLAGESIIINSVEIWET